MNDLEQFKKDLIEFCVSKGYEISGTCDTEGIYGEITIARIGEAEGEDFDWLDWEKNKFNFK